MQNSINNYLTKMLQVEILRFLVQDEIFWVVLDLHRSEYRTKVSGHGLNYLPAFKAAMLKNKKICIAA